MRKIRKDLAGQRFGRLTVLEPVGISHHNVTVWRCLCTCGNLTDVRSDTITSGDVKSCGCLTSDIIVERAALMRESNLAEGTNLGNIKANKIGKGNTSGIRGVSWHRKTRMWQVRIQIKGQQVHLGYTLDLDEAKKMRLEAEDKYFKPLINAKKPD